METLDALLATYPWGIYLCFVLGPFLQEDAAVIGAAAASSTGAGHTGLLFLSILAGLAASDLWKYWIGYAARSHNRADAFAMKPGVQNARDKVANHLGKTLMMIRYLPGTRIPFYLASGFFKVSFVRFSFYIILSGLTYIGISFVLFHALGAVAGEQARHYVPLAAGVLIVSLLAFLLGKAYLNKKAAA